MRYFSLFIVTLLLISSCTSPAEQTVTDSTDTSSGPSIGATFTPVATALQSGTSVAEVGGMLMQRFHYISNPQTGSLNQQESNDFLYLAQQLAEKFPQDTLAALPLYRSAEVARALNDSKKAASIYEKVFQQYPSFSKAPEALFMLAFTYDEDLKDYEQARTYYTEFVDMYPENVFAKSVPMLLENLGKSDEEILEQLQTIEE